MVRSRAKLGTSQQAMATTIVRRSPRGSPAAHTVRKSPRASPSTQNTLNKNQSSKNPIKDGTENVVFASVVPLRTTEKTVTLEIAHAGPVEQTSSAQEALPAEEGIKTRTGNPTEGTLTDVAGGMADTANSKQPLVPYEDSDEDKADQDKINSDDEATAAAKAQSSLRELDREDSNKAAKAKSPLGVLDMEPSDDDRTKRRGKKSKASGKGVLDMEESDDDLRKRRGKKSKASGKGGLDMEESDDDLTKPRRKKSKASGKGVLDVEESIEASGKGEAGSEVSDDASNKEPETEDSDAAVTPVKEHPAIAKVQRGRKQKPFSPSGVLTLPCFLLSCLL